jgi:D-alanyl-D-alanine carboxypeptidase
MMKARTALVALASVVMLVSQGPSAATGSERGIERALERVVEMPDGPPGASALLVRGHDRSFIEVGVRSVNGDRPFIPDAHMRIASTSKAFNGAVLLSLVDEGALELDDTVGDVLPSLPEEWTDVTLRQMLDHTSGLPNYTVDPAFLAYFTTHLHGSITPQAIIDMIDPELAFTPPGSSYAYSNTDNLVAALMAEQATGRSYERLLRSEVFRPLKLRGTSLPDDFHVPPAPRILGYDVAPPSAPEDVTTCCSMSYVWASGGMVSTPRDLARFTRGYVGGRLFGGVVRAEQFQFVPGGGSEPPGPGENSAGLSLFRYRTKCGTVFGHTGNFPGYTQFTAASRNGRRSVTISVNEQLNPEDQHPAVFEKLHHAYRVGACEIVNR